MYSFEISDYTFFSIYQKMYNIAVIFLHSVWLSNAFFAGWRHKTCPQETKIIHCSRNNGKMYNRA